MDTVRDERGVVVGWLTKCLLALAVLGVVVYDAGAVMVNYFGLDSTAKDIAFALAADMNDQGVPDTRTVTERAEQLAREAGARLLRAEVTADGTLQVRIKRPAETLIVRRVDALAPYGRAVADARARVS